MIDTSLEGFEGGASSWNDLTDKPFYEEGSGATITWDGNTEGLESSNSFLGATSYHVSDLTPSIDELIGGNLAFSDGQSLEVAEDWIMTLSDDVNMIGELSVFVAYKENATFTHSNTTVVFPKQGVYFTKGSDGVFYTSSLIYGSSIIKTLDEKFIPDTIARKSDITGGAGGVSSWNDLTDKPFGDEIAITNKYLDNFTLEVTTSEPHPIPHFPITMGKVYDVTVNGVDYECSPFIVEDVPAIGNSMAMGGSDNGMPFIIGDTSALSGEELCLLIPLQPGTFTISISTTVTEVTKLDPKFLPEGGFGYEEGEPVTISTDIDMDSAEIINDPDGKPFFVKISDTVIDPVGFIGATIEIIENGEVIETFETNSDNTEIMSFSNDFGAVSLMGKFPLYIVKVDNFTMEGITFSKKGIYAIYEMLGGPIFNITCGPIIHKIDEKFIPGISLTNLKGEPFCEAFGELVLCDDTFSFITSDNLFLSQSSITSAILEVGYTYDLVLDGTEYKNLVCFDNNGTPTLGSSYSELDSGISEIPFSIYGSKDFGLFLYTSNSGTTHDIRLVQTSLGLKLNEKYIPDTIARVEDLGDIGSGLPEVTTENDGQILGVSDGAWVVMDAPSGLPAVTTANNGKILGVTDGAWTVMSAPSGLPEITTETEGAFLRVVNGVPTWVLMENAEDGEY